VFRPEAEIDRIRSRRPLLSQLARQMSTEVANDVQPSDAQRVGPPCCASMRRTSRSRCSLLISTGLFIGFVTLISPGGLGVREAVLLAGLGGLPCPC